jgi:hypothetical protein
MYAQLLSAGSDPSLIKGPLFRKGSFWRLRIKKAPSANFREPGQQSDLIEWIGVIVAATLPSVPLLDQFSTHALQAGSRPQLHMQAT